MIRRFMRLWLPDPASMRTHRSLRWISHLLDRQWLWHVNLSSISKGLAIGMFCGILVPFGQGLVAGVVAIGLRANLPVAVITTFVSNPLTTPAILLAAYFTGSSVLGKTAALPVLSGNVDWVHTISAMGEPLLLGLALLAVAAAALSYLGVQLAWRIGVGWRMAAKRTPTGS